MQRKPRTKPKSKYVDNNDSAVARFARPRTDLNSVRGILGSVLRKHGLDRKIEEYDFVLRWHEIVGEKVAKVSKPDCIRKNALFVKVSSSAWAQELSFLKADLLEKLKKSSPMSSGISDIRFQVGDLNR